ncbi:ATP-binding protein [Geodermatophilus sp. SYSU D00779]
MQLDDDLRRMNYLQPGDRARLLVQGRQESHSVSGIVTDVSVETVSLNLDGTAKTINFPAASIVTVEVAVAGRGRVSPPSTWRRVALPPPMAVLVAALDGALLTGAGALIRELDSPVIARLESQLHAVQSGLTTPRIEHLIEACLHCLDPCRLLLATQQYDEAHREYQRFNHLVDAAIAENARIGDSRRLREALQDILARLRDLVRQYWKKYQALSLPRPRIVQVQDPVTVSVARNGETILPFRLYLGDSHAPAEQLRIQFNDIPGLAVLGGLSQLPRLESGQEKTLSVPVAIDSHLVKRGTLRLRGQISFTGAGQGRMVSPMQTIEFRLLLPEEFREIPNPYTAYAGGTTVSDPRMFFGRGSLIEELSSQLSSGPPGQCFALYGQKRTGKSSVLEQVRRCFEGLPIIPVSISFGTIDFESAGITSALVREILEQTRVPLLTGLPQSKARMLEDLWPDDRRISDRPLESLRTALLAGRQLLAREEGWAGLRYVLLVDEFTYLFEVLRHPEPNPHQVASVRDFMRQWKALLESQIFSALVVGQDTMPYFMRRFPNEFSSLTTRRLSYLDYDETTNLANHPIRRADGSSRYTGHALSVLYSYTDGHPFFTQIVCERLVRRANQAQRGDLGEQDVLEAIESLLSGEQMIDFHRFDCFLTADNTGLLASIEETETASATYQYDSAGEEALRLLSQIATLGGHQNRPVLIESLRLEESDRRVLNDLILRGVLTSEEGAVKIKVTLFADYLRRQW